MLLLIFTLSIFSYSDRRRQWSVFVLVRISLLLLLMFCVMMLMQFGCFITTDPCGFVSVCSYLWIWVVNLFYVQKFAFWSASKVIDIPYLM